MTVPLRTQSLSLLTPSPSSDKDQGNQIQCVWELPYLTADLWLGRTLETWNGRLVPGGRKGVQQGITDADSKNDFYNI